MLEYERDELRLSNTALTQQADILQRRSDIGDVMCLHYSIWNVEMLICEKVQLLSTVEAIQLELVELRMRNETLLERLTTLRHRYDTGDLVSSSVFVLKPVLSD